MTSGDKSMILCAFFNGIVGVLERLRLNGNRIACVLLSFILIFHLANYCCRIVSELLSLLIIVFVRFEPL